MTEPKLRFKRDNGSNYPAWNEAPLGTLITDNLDPVPTPREGYRRVGIYCHAKGTFQEDVPAEKVLDVDTMYRIHKNNLIVNITFAWEHAVAIVKPEDEGLLVSHRFPEYSFNEGQLPAFYKYLVLRSYFKNQLSLASPGGAGRNRVLNKAQFKKIPVTVPCLEEQQKIADFLSSVDEVITASEAEVANLETQKKAVMKKIFSQEVRFKRADGSEFPEWEEKLFYDCVDISANMVQPDVELYGELPHIGPGNIEKGTGHLTDYKLVKDENLISGKYLFSETDVIYGKINPQLMKVVYPKFKGLCSADAYPISVHPDVMLPDFLLYSLLDERFVKYSISVSMRTGMPKINRDELGYFKFRVPCLEEQRLIADFLSNFDEAIAAAKKELELWKELKKGLLQQMFV